MHHATSRNVTCSIPNYVIGIFIDNLSGRPVVDWASNRNEYQGVEMILPTSCAECPELWEPQPPAVLRACPGRYRDSFAFTFSFII